MLLLAAAAASSEQQQQNGAGMAGGGGAYRCSNLGGAAVNSGGGGRGWPEAAKTRWHTRDRGRRRTGEWPGGVVVQGGRGVEAAELGRRSGTAGSRRRDGR